MTTNEIQVFSNSQFGDIRTAGTPEQPLFSLADVCNAIGIANPRNVKNRLDEWDVHSVDTPTMNQHGATVMQQMTYITESGLYDVIIRSESEKAKPFRRWVTSEVLPSIRKTGGYMVSKADDTPEEIMARALLVAQSTLDRQQKRLAEQSEIIDMQEQRIREQKRELEESAQKVQYYDETLTSVNGITMTKAANAIGLSVYQLTDRLQALNVIYKQGGQWLLRVPYCQWGLHQTRTRTYTRSDGETGSRTYTVWTQNGMRFITLLGKHDFNMRAAKAEFFNSGEPPQARKPLALPEPRHEPTEPAAGFPAEIKVLRTHYKLKMTEAMCYALIKSHGKMTVPIAYIAEQLSLTTRVVQYAVKKLRESGLITVEYGNGTPSTYICNDLPE